METGRRITKPDKFGCFRYKLKDHKPHPSDFGNYAAFDDYQIAVMKLGMHEDMQDRLIAWMERIKNVDIEWNSAELVAILKDFIVNGE